MDSKHCRKPLAAVRWKKVSAKKRKKISGYEVQVAKDKAFTNIVKTVKAGRNASSKKIRGLKWKAAGACLISS